MAENQFIPKNPQTPLRVFCVFPASPTQKKMLQSIKLRTSTIWIAFREASEDSEPLTQDDIQSIEKTYQEIEQGDTLFWDEIAPAIPSSVGGK